MCRIIFINTQFNKNILSKFFDQSIKKKYTPNLDNPRDQDLHLDGFGFIWNEKNKTFMYKNYLRPNMDYNLKTILDLIDTEFFIGHLRATKKLCSAPVNYHSTHPFNYQDFYFCHNGCVSNFKNNKKIILDGVSMKYYSMIKSNCDSEYLFYLFLSIFDITDNSSILKRLKITVDKFFEFLNLISGVVSANIMIKYKDIVIVTRFINNDEEPPSLYRNEDYTIISSEPVMDNEILIEKNSIIIFKNKNYKKFKV